MVIGIKNPNASVALVTQLPLHNLKEVMTISFITGVLSCILSLSLTMSSPINIETYCPIEIETYCPIEIETFCPINIASMDLSTEMQTEMEFSKDVNFVPSEEESLVLKTFLDWLEDGNVELNEYIKDLCAQYEVPCHFVLAIIYNESRFLPDSINLNKNKSKEV